MELIPLASESLGVRSLALAVRHKGYTLILDPGAALAPRRGGYPPHSLEVQALAERWEAIREVLAEAQAIVLTHYHHDHWNPQAIELFFGKKLFLKDPRSKINRNQAIRGEELLLQLAGKAEITLADGGHYRAGPFRLTFSPPLPHGADRKGRTVLSVIVEGGGHRLLFSSDVEGFPWPVHLKFALESGADLIVADGAATYLGRPLPKENLLTLLRALRPKLFLIEHHLLRDPNWRTQTRKIEEEARRIGTFFGCYADYLGVPERLLEAQRKTLFSTG